MSSGLAGGRPGAGGDGLVDDGSVEEDAALAGVAEVHLRGAGLAGERRTEQLVFQGRVVQVGLARGAPGGAVLGANPGGGGLVGGDEVLHLGAGLSRSDVGDEVGEALHGVLVGGEAFVQVVGAGRCQLHDRGGRGVAHEGLNLPEVEQVHRDGDGGEDGHDDQACGHDLTAVYFDGVHGLPFLLSMTPQYKAIMPQLWRDSLLTLVNRGGAARLANGAGASCAGGAVGPGNPVRAGPGVRAPESPRGRWRGWPREGR